MSIHNHTRFTPLTLLITWNTVVVGRSCEVLFIPMSTSIPQALTNPLRSACQSYRALRNPRHTPQWVVSATHWTTRSTGYYYEWTSWGCVKGISSGLWFSLDVYYIRPRYSRVYNGPANSMLTDYLPWLVVCDSQVLTLPISRSPYAYRAYLGGIDSTITTSLRVPLYTFHSNIVPLMFDFNRIVRAFVYQQKK